MIGDQKGAIYLQAQLQL